VTARNTDTGQTRTDTTESDGSYRFEALPVGNYAVTVAAKGFQQSVHSGLTLTVAQQIVANFTLQVGSALQKQSATITQRKTFHHKNCPRVLRLLTRFFQTSFPASPTLVQ
jgi:Carboxypeptidase regulatory-like domain